MKCFDVVSRDRRHRHGAEQGLYVPLDPATVGQDRAGLLGGLAPRQDAPGFGIGQVQVAQLRNAN